MLATTDKQNSSVPELDVAGTHKQALVKQSCAHLQRIIQESPNQRAKASDKDNQSASTTKLHLNAF